MRVVYVSATMRNMDGYITTREAGELANVSQNYIRKLAKDDRLIYRRIGSIIMIRKTSVLKYRKEADKYNASKGRYKTTEPTK